MPLCGGIIEQRPFNIFGMDLFESFEHDASVYVCNVVKREPSLSESGRNIERGVITLNVIQTLRGTNRVDLVLPYSFIPRGGIGVDGPLIWPTLDDVGQSNLLCIIVPSAQDSSAPTIPGNNEAASMVVVVDKNEGAVLEMEVICKIYGSKVTPKFIRQLKKAVASPQLTVRGFALETTIMKLGKTSPEEALEIIRSRVAAYRESAKHLTISKDPLDEGAFAMYTQNSSHADIFEAEKLFSDISSGILKIGPEEKFCTFLCRCLIALAQSESKTIREKAITGLANGISFYDYRPDLHFRPLDGIDISERKALNTALDVESCVGDTNMLTNIHLIRNRLVPIFRSAKAHQPAWTSGITNKQI